VLDSIDADAPVAVLTRASIRPQKAMSFWRRAPGTERALAESPGCELAIGLGEAPLLRQCTFSVWRDTPSMEGYARGGAHGRAAQFAWREGHFSESLFVRMRVLASAGAWPMPGGAHAG
jgi:spheroidene monooxygenase